MNVNLGGDLMPAMICWVVASFVLWAIVHVLFAVGVYQTAKGRPTELAAPWVWALATLLGGPLIAVAYWALHLSGLARPFVRARYEDAFAHHDEP